VAFRWHDILPLRDDIDRKTSCVNSAFALVFGSAPHTMNGGACATGYTDFTNQLCWLNAEAVKAPAAEQFVMTVYLAAHERAHALWTDYHKEDFYQLDDTGKPKLQTRDEPLYDRALHTAWNILEDERIERLLGRDFPHLHPYLRAGSRTFLSIIGRETPDNDPNEVLRYVLRRRIATRAGKKERCLLSSENVALLALCEPLLDEAFGCTSSRRVVAIAREVLDILKLDEQPSEDSSEETPGLSEQQGERTEGEAKSDGASAEEGELTQAGEDGDIAERAKQRMAGLGYSPGKRTGGDVDAAPYEELQRSVRPYVFRLRPLFDITPVRRRDEYEASGGRLSIRAARCDIREPFRVESPPVSPGNVALTLVIDDSSSMTDVVNTTYQMGVTGEREGKRTAMLCVNALPLPHRLRVVLAPSGRVAADPSLGEMSRAQIAGYNSPNGTEYATVLQGELTRLERTSGAYTRYLGLVADGATGSGDLDRCRALVRRARAANVHFFGIGVGANAEMHEFFRSAFGEQYVALTTMDSLVPQMQRILQRIAKTVRRSM
jgi:hypothetical protein